ncbi:MAG: ThiF family adenylyltransferase [Elusimicrobiales bacterium]|nr:ThiF family adenylyltransferase [Elusimicrobiales bacterium]
MTLSREELIRYSRQLVIPGVGPEGQEKLKAASVAVIGAGGLGNIVMAYLAGAGVGELGVFDFGPVELSNLHRQFIYGTGDVGGLKTELAARRLAEINPGVKVSAREGMLTPENMTAALAGYDLVADCTDNFTARAAINRACLELGKTYVHAAVYQLEGQLAVFSPGRGACLGCLSPDLEEEAEPQACAEAGVMGPAAGAVASMQALEVLKLIVGFEALRDRFVMLDFRLGGFHAAELPRRPDCPVCGGKASADREFLRSVTPDYIAAEELKSAMDSASPPRLIDLRYGWEHDLAHIPGDERADHELVLIDGAGLRAEEDIVLYCKGQSKSAAAWKALKSRGFERVRVLKGGLDAWAERIDRTMTRY